VLSAGNRLPWERSGFAWLAHADAAAVTDANASARNASAGAGAGGAQQDVLRDVRRIFEEHDVFLADTLVGQRDWEDYAERQQGAWLRDRVNHNSHVIVIRRRRDGPRTTPVSRGARTVWRSRTPQNDLGD
jgi:hypothetical protein